MKHLMIYSASLSLLVAVSVAHGDYWEEQEMTAEPVMSEGSEGSTNRVSYDPAAVENNRRFQLERGLYDEFDLEDLPPTAAGNPEEGDTMMEDSGDHDYDVHRGQRKSKY